MSRRRFVARLEVDYAVLELERHRHDPSLLGTGDGMLEHVDVDREVRADSERRSVA